MGEANLKSAENAQHRQGEVAMAVRKIDCGSYQA
jgi:hypothetical protein